MRGAIKAILFFCRGAIVLFLFPIVQASDIAKMEHIILALGMKRRRLRNHLFAGFTGNLFFVILGHDRSFPYGFIQTVLSRTLFQLEEKPVMVFRILAFKLDQAVSAAEDTAFDFKDPFGGRRLLRNIASLIPDFHGSGPVFAFWNRPLEAGIGQRMVLDLDGQPSDAFSDGRLFGDRPALQHAFLFQAQVKVKTVCLMALDDVNQIRFFLAFLFLGLPSRLGRLLEIPFFFICP